MSRTSLRPAEIAPHSAYEFGRTSALLLVGVGLVAALLGLYGGASVNPARRSGPALLAGAGSHAHLWVSLTAPLAGPVLVALALRLTADRRTEPASA